MALSIGCSCAERCDEYNGWRCTITDGACMYMFPNSKACARDWGEGPDAVDEEEDVKNEDGI